MFLPRTLLVVALTIPWLVESIQAADPNPTFAAVVQSRYPAWTKGNLDGKLLSAHVDALVNNSKVQGEEAAAIAAIHHYLRGKDAPKLVDDAFLLAPNNSEGPEGRPEVQTKDPKFQQLYSSFLRHLKSVPRGLFEEDAPQRTGMHQGRLGDCFVVSAVGAMVSLHPDRLKSMIEEQRDGSYIVRFPEHQPINVPKLTDAQIVLGSTAGKQGLWLNVMEEAIAIEQHSKGTPKVAVDSISSGGGCVPIIEALTRHKVKQIPLNTAAAKDLAGTEREARSILLAVHERKFLACAGTEGKDKGTLPPGIASGHAYGVIGYDAGKGLVMLWNPWGNKFEPKGASGIANGYSTRDGVFTMPLSDFVRVFHTLEGQTSAPLPKPAKK